MTEATMVSATEDPDREEVAMDLIEQGSIEATDSEQGGSGRGDSTTDSADCDMGRGEDTEIGCTDERGAENPLQISHQNPRKKS
ncbi:hypothetical protein NPIL_681731 [Nephila pilipes]|uniref:Uncharacterized protein n=1 Tax=Nephila pilipes TaxID=299642 RepID=A0A8X6PUG4_NEPPI|nr:hypothetical protein NPIL_681731 [Nephila pilipes]